MKAPRRSLSGSRHLVAAIVALAIGPSAPGDIVDLEFGGTVTSVYNPNSAVSSSLIRVGDPVHISVRYDTSTEDYRPDDNWGGYRSVGWLKVRIGDLAFERDNGVQVEVLHGANGNQELFQVGTDGPTSAWPDALSGPEFIDRRLMLGIWETQPPIDLIAGPELPTSIDVTRADYAIGDVGVSHPSGLNAYSVQFRLSQIPEPGVGALFVLGALCGAAFQRRKN